MKAYRLLVCCAAISFLGIVGFAQDIKKLRSAAIETETAARTLGNANGELINNAADKKLLTNGARSTRIRDSASISGSFVTVVGKPLGEAPEFVKIAPDSLFATFYGDWPNTDFCKFNLPVRNAITQGAPSGCNDTLSHVDVPLNVVVGLAEHDGKGATGFGRYKKFGAGSHAMGDFCNDCATTFWVYDTNENYLYFTSDSEEVPSGWTIGVKYTATDDTSGFGTILGLDTNWYYKTYSFKLPAYCANPDLWESTKAGNAEWSYQIKDKTLSVTLKVKPQLPLASNNWIGVGIRCKP